MNDQETPHLELFRTTPTDLLARPPLASSLQSFESALFLVALRRYPHALTTCVFAAESATKAAGLNVLPTAPLQQLLAAAREAAPAVAAVPLDLIDRLRQARNHIVHDGFSPKDDEVAARLLLEAAVPLLMAVYEGLFRFDLLESLELGTARHLRIALAAFREAERLHACSPLGCLLALGHYLRRCVRDASESHAEFLATEAGENGGHHWEAVSKTLAALSSQLEPAWQFECPVCRGEQSGQDSLIVELDLEHDPVRIKRAVCGACDLQVPTAAALLANVMLKEQLEGANGRILHEFGIQRDAAYEKDGRS